MIVLDASATVEWIERRGTLGARVGERIAAADSLHVPHLWFVEVVQVLRRHELAGSITPEHALAAVHVVDDLPATRYPHEPLRQRIWALRHNLTAYDATYIALAEALQAPLLTTDAALAGSPGHQARVELLTA